MCTKQEAQEWIEKLKLGRCQEQQRMVTDAVVNNLDPKTKKVAGRVLAVRGMGEAATGELLLKLSLFLQANGSERALADKFIRHSAKREAAAKLIDQLGYRSKQGDRDATDHLVLLREQINHRLEGAYRGTNRRYV